MLQRLLPCSLLLVCLCLPAQAADAVTAPSAYREIMNAQYATHQKALPSRPEEAQRTYENYLQSLGKPARDLSTDSGANGSTPSR